MSLAAHEMMYIQFLIFLFLLHQLHCSFYGSSFVGHKMKLRVKEEEEKKEEARKEGGRNISRMDRAEVCKSALSGDGRRKH